MLKPRGLGRRVAQGPHSFPAFSDNSRQKTHQTKSVTFRFPCHCDLFSPVETDSGALSDNSRKKKKNRIRPFQTKSGNFRQNQAFFRHFQAKSGRIRQNQAKSGKIGQPIGSGISLVRDLCCSKNHKLLPRLGRVFLGAQNKTKAQANYNQTASNGIILPKTWQLC